MNKKNKTLIIAVACMVIAIVTTMMPLLTLAATINTPNFTTTPIIVSFVVALLVDAAVGAIANWIIKH